MAFRDSSPRYPVADLTALQRVCVVMAALALIYWRTPLSFTHPQFWGEDIFFYDDARTMGWHSLFTRLAGYLTAAQYLVGIVASPFNPVMAPAIFCYSAILLTLLVVWLVTSPRLDMPLKPVLAIAVVIVPMGQEELGTLCNIQWILPIGAFALLFMRASPSNFVLLGESAFLAITALSGPFSIFLAPMFVWQAWRATNAPDRNRMILLTAIVGTAGVIQGLQLIGSQTPEVRVPYPWTLWITLPLKRIMTTFSIASRQFDGLPGAIIGGVAVGLAVALAFLRPYRTQKAFILVFSLLIVIGGMVKFRHDLSSQVGAQRYFYIASVLAPWFICCISDRRAYQRWSAGVLIVFGLILLPVTKDRSWIRQDREWPAWARHASSGVAFAAPTWPEGFYFVFPAAADGPLSAFSAWIGRDIRDVATLDPTACAGTIDMSQQAAAVQTNGRLFEDKPLLVWASSGTVESRSGPAPELIAIADSDGVVLGFGFPGFKNSKWQALTITPRQGALMYGVSSNARVCALESAIP